MKKNEGGQVILAKYLLKKGNHKLSREQGIWTLPPGITCIGAGECRKYCYAIKARGRMKQVVESRLRHLWASLSTSFVSRMVDEIKRRGILVVRIHEAGDLGA